MASIDLCTLADVRLAMETATADVALDPEISDLITKASRAIMDVAVREFAPPTGNATRRRDVRHHLVDLAPYDLRNATQVIFDPDATAQVLTAHVDYELLPIGGDKDGLYTEIRLSNFLWLQTAKMISFGHADISIAGAWGYAAIPEPVKDACVVAVRSWLRRDVTTYAQIDNAGAQPQAYGTYKLPPASLSKIDPYMRYPKGMAV